MDIFLKSSPNYAIGGNGININNYERVTIRILDNETQIEAWKQQLGTPNNDTASAITTDANGNVYSIGTGSDPFLRQQDSEGNEIWTINLEDNLPANTVPTDISIDSADNIYIVGKTNNTDPWISKYDNTGNFQWQQPLNPDANITGIVIGSDGSLYLTGTTTGSLDGINPGETDAWIAKYDNTGTEVWVKQLGTPGIDTSNSIAIDNSGNLYIAGSTQGALTGSAEGDGDAWVAKYDSTGNQVWVQQFGSVAQDVANAVAVDNAGHVYLTGQTQGWIGQTYMINAAHWIGDYQAWWNAIHGDLSGLGGTYYGNGDAWVAQLSEEDGLINWRRSIGTPAVDTGAGVVADQFGNVYIAGNTQGAIVSGNHKGSDDVFLAKYNVNGALQWKQQFGTVGSDLVTDINLDGSIIHLAGSTTGNWEGIGAGGTDAWVMQLA